MNRPSPARRRVPPAACALAALLLALGGCRTPRLGEQEPLPESGFSAYTGTESRAGDYHVRVAEYVHPETGMVVALVPMVHIGDPSFYLAVQEELDRADLVLVEGIGGPASLGPFLAVKEYVFGNVARHTSHLGLAGQGEVLRRRATWRNGDMSAAEFQSSMPWYAPLLQIVELPFMVAVLEPAHLVAWLRDTTDVVRSREDRSDVAERHFVCRVLNDGDDEDEDDSADWLLPGAVTRRNEALLAKLERVQESGGVRRVALPWGAAHMPGIAHALATWGYRPGDSRWLRVIRVRGLMEPDEEAERLTESHFQIPYALHWRRVGESASLGMAAGSIFTETRADGTGQVNLLWDLLLTWRGDPEADATRLTLLPYVFGRPLLLDWTARGDRHRVRALLFLDFGSL